MNWKRLPSQRWLKIPVFVLCLAPVLTLAWKALHQDLGANPIEFITHATGDWTLRFLAITLTVSPLRRLLGMPDLIRFRRMLGLFAFFYGCLHFTTYLWLDKFFNLDEIAKDVWKRPFITAGFLGFVSMTPLALTSTAGWIRRLGGRRWQMLHRLIYLSAAAGVVHYYWLVKSDVRKPLLYAAIVFVLFAERGAARFRKRRAGSAAQLSTPRAAPSARLTE
jgi:sulfoxide reductase heme-binding subunit YedZ